MKYVEIQNGVVTNIVVADEVFARQMGLLPYVDGCEIGKPYPSTPEERIASLEAENRRKDAQIAALSEQNDFQEELIVELANIIYA